MSEKKAVEALISGRVQGVCFRMETERAAEKLNLTGWVKNLPDGRVHALFEGKPEQVDAVLRWCEQGPPMARVDEVIVTQAPVTGAYDGFDIRY
ncbi:MAG: acylphosphatase [Deltaproteobacteria bacterium]|nr:acylphosphatase [Deltaproteobacteria bacterium]